MVETDELCKDHLPNGACPNWGANCDKQDFEQQTIQNKSDQEI